MFGYGTYDQVVATLDDLLSRREHVCGDRFTAVDVYLGSAVLWGTQFGTLPSRDSFAAYVDRLKARAGFRRAWQLDDEDAARLQSLANLPQPEQSFS